MKAKHEESERFGTEGRGERGKEGMSPERQQGYMGRHGQGPEQGQGHNGTSARLSDAGSHGRRHGQEPGSHGGAHREHVNPGTRTRRRGGDR